MIRTIRFCCGPLVLLIALLSIGCEDPSSSEPTGATYYVDGLNGSDSNSGNEDNPFERLTYAIGVAAEGDTIMVMPGTYRTSDGESFPLTLKPNQRLIGDPDADGIGTAIIGDGDTGDGYTATLIAAAGNVITGIEFQDSDTDNGYFGIYVDDATITVASCSFTTGYGGVILQGSGNSIVSENVFRTFSYGVYIGEVSGNITINTNDLEGEMTIPVNVTNAGSGTVISGNVIKGNGSSGIGLQNGNPLITGNTFNYNNPSDTNGYTFGAISNQNSTARVTGNSFDCHSPAIFIRNGFGGGGGALDVGTSIAPGGNDFSTVIGTSIVVEAGVTVDIHAVGNAFPNNPPISGTDIDNQGDANVYYTASSFY